MRWLLLFVLTFSLHANYLDQENIWLDAYQNYRHTQELQDEKKSLKKKLRKRLNRKTKTKLLRELEIVEYKLDIASNQAQDFSSILKSLDLDVEKRSITLLSYLSKSDLKEIHTLESKYELLSDEYDTAIAHIEQALNTAVDNNESKRSKVIRDDLNYFISFRSLLDEQHKNILYKKRVLEQKLTTYEKVELFEILLGIGVIFLGFLIIAFSKPLINRYVEDEDLQVQYSKSIFLTTLVALFLFIIFKFTSNIQNALTILGIIAVGLIIVLKEYILNLVGWLYLTFGSTVNIGDRILVMGNNAVIGDVIDISLSRITIYEGITYNSAMDLKRAGRIAFIPNNYLFTHVIYNYTHKNMKTIYDLIELDFSFDTDFEKAELIAQETVEQYTSRYREMAKGQYKQLQQKYVMRNLNLEPRVQFIINEEKNGVTMYLWYIAPYREVLNTRSTITVDLIRHFKEAQGIHILNDA